MKTDVLLLADVFEEFRNLCLTNYELDPYNYYSSPRVAGNAILKKTGVKLELLSDLEIFMFFKQAMRGGIYSITHRYAKANNKYMPDFNKNDPISWIFYLDANNLYG